MKQEILIPSYYNQFKCIGSDCEDTCCAGWKVSVDKQSFNNYRKITSGPLAKELKQNISREQKTPSDLNYAKIKMDENGACTLLREDGLCKIQSALAESYLCYTCATYPRHVNTIDERLEKSLVVSCPEAARLILLTPNGIDFIVEEQEVTSITRNIKSDEFWSIRMFAIELLQTRGPSIEERLIVLGLFSEKLESTNKNIWQQELPKLIERYRQFISSTEQLALLTDLPDNISFQLDLVRKLLQGRIANGLSSQRFLDCTNDLVSGLQMGDGQNVELTVNLYKDSYETYYKPFMHERAYILENYLVNFLFKNTFPQSTAKLFNQYVNMVIHFILIKLHLIGMANTHKGLTEDLIIKCIQSFSKTFEHNSHFFINVMNELEQQNYLNMAYMTILIKS